MIFGIKEVVGWNGDCAVVGNSSYGNCGVDGGMDTPISGQEGDVFVPEVVDWSGEWMILHMKMAVSMGAWRSCFHDLEWTYSKQS
jgi:hypothetical protein